MKKFIITILLLIFLANIALADRYVFYNVSDGILVPGTYVKGDNALTDVGVLGFTCEDAECMQVNNSWSFNGNTGNDNEIVFNFPTQLKSSYGYSAIFYKPGFVTWEQAGIDYRGTLSGENINNPTFANTTYLTKVQECRADVDSFFSINTIHPNVPIVVNVSAKLTGKAYSALSHSGPIGYVPEELKDEYYSIDTEVRLEIFDKDGFQVLDEMKTVLIEFSDSETISFNWTPEFAGAHRAVLTSKVIDDKCLSAPPMTTTKEFDVFDESPVCDELKRYAFSDGHDSSHECWGTLGYYYTYEECADIGGDYLLTEESRFMDNEGKFACIKKEHSSKSYEACYNYLNSIYGDTGNYIGTGQNSNPLKGLNVNNGNLQAIDQNIAVAYQNIIPQTCDKGDGVCYTLLNNLTASPRYAEKGDIVSVGVYKMSNTAANGTITPINTDMILKIYDEDNNVVHNESIIAVANPDNYGFELIQFTEWPSTVTGPLKIVVEAEADSCAYDNNSGYTQTVDFFIEENKEPEFTQPLPDIELEKDSGLNDGLIDLWNYVTDEETPLDQLVFSIIGQTDTSVTFCTIRDNRYIDCQEFGKEGESTVTVEVFDGVNRITGSFKVTVGDIDKLVLDEVIFDGITLSENVVTATTRGDHDVKVDVTAFSDLEDVEIGIHIMGVNGASDITELFNMSDGDSVSKMLELSFPSDMPSDIYSLRVRAMDRSNELFIAVFTLEITDSQCNDGIDNDQDGFTDYPFDFGCDSIFDDNETNGGENECNNGIDDDGDGKIDQDDPDCDSKDDDSENTCDLSSECGQDGYIGETFCQGDDVVQDYISYTCNSPGNDNSYCSNETSTHVIISDCEFGCSDGECAGEDEVTCSTNLDCGTDGYFGVSFCENDNTIGHYRTYECLNPGTKDSECTYTEQKDVLETCSYGCSYGVCRTEEREAISSDLYIDDINFGLSDKFSVEDQLHFSITLKNDARVDIEDLKVAVLIYDLGVFYRFGHFDIDDGDSVTKGRVFDIPYSAPPGRYDVRITISNDDIKRVVHREIDII